MENVKFVKIKEGRYEGCYQVLLDGVFIGNAYRNTETANGYWGAWESRDLMSTVISDSRKRLAEEMISRRNRNRAK